MEWLDCVFFLGVRLSSLWTTKAVWENGHRMLIGEVLEAELLFAFNRFFSSSMLHLPIPELTNGIVSL